MLKLVNVKKRFGDFEAVKGIDISIEAGEIIGLLGPNGAGKSTTISMISTLFKPTEGDILFNGESILKNPNSIQPYLGYVPQEIALYESLNGYENLKYFGGLYGLKGEDLKERIEVVSEIIGIGDRLKSRVSTYSGGMKRRLNIGVALLHSPQIVIMDEPTVGIDPQSRNHILETVKRLNEMGMTLIYTSHYMEEVEAICKKIFIMDEGQVIAEGTREALIEQSGIQTAIKLKVEHVDQEIVKEIKLWPEVMNVNVDNECELTILSTGNQTSHQEIIKRVLNAKMGLVSFDIVKPDLEQIFLKMTGKALRD